MSFDQHAVAVWRRQKQLVETMFARYEAEWGDTEAPTWDELYAMLPASERAEMAEHLCWGCGRDMCREHYMVHDRLWARAGMSDGLLCLPCLAVRLGRGVTVGDLTAAPINDVWRVALSCRGLEMERWS